MPIYRKGSRLRRVQVYNFLNCFPFYYPLMFVYYCPINSTYQLVCKLILNKATVAYIFNDPIDKQKVYYNIKYGSNVIIGSSWNRMRFISPVHMRARIRHLCEHNLLNEPCKRISYNLLSQQYTHIAYFSLEQVLMYIA